MKPKIFDNFLDLKFLTKSGKILIFEFKKGIIRTSDVKQLYEYYDRVHCKEKRDVLGFLISISDKGRISDYTHFDITYHPTIIKTKSINHEKSLSSIRYKFNNNIKLTSKECCLLTTFPLFETGVDESDIVEEMCQYIRDKKDCIPSDELDSMIMAMYLNIIEYVDVEKHSKLMEMIELNKTSEGVLARLRNEGKKEGEKNFLLRLLEDHSLKEVSNFIKMDISDIEKIINSS